MNREGNPKKISFFLLYNLRILCARAALLVILIVSMPKGKNSSAFILNSTGEGLCVHECPFVITCVTVWGCESTNLLVWTVSWWKVRQIQVITAAQFVFLQLPNFFLLYHFYSNRYGWNNDADVSALANERLWTLFLHQQKTQNESLDQGSKSKLY